MANLKNRVGGSGYWLKRRNQAMSGARYQMAKAKDGTEVYPGEGVLNASVCVEAARHANRERVAALRIERYTAAAVEVVL